MSQRTIASGVLLDIRERYEADLVPLPGAMRIPLGTLLADPMRAPQGAAVLVVDHDGSRVAFATRYLRSHGIDAIPVRGGAIALTRV